jgi:hypothetical protein
MTNSVQTGHNNLCHRYCLLEAGDGNNSGVPTASALFDIDQQATQIETVNNKPFLRNKFLRQRGCLTFSATPPLEAETLAAVSENNYRLFFIEQRARP